MSARNTNFRGAYTSGYFPSLKLKRMVPFKSLLERDYLYVLDYDTDILSFEERPITVTYQHEGKSRHYQPSFLVRTLQSVSLVECKLQEWIDDDGNQYKLEAVRNWCTDNAVQFQLITEQELDSDHKLLNIKLLTRYARQSVGPDFRARLFGALASLPQPVMLANLAKIVDGANPSAAASNILHLVFHHVLTIDLEEVPISGASVILLPYFDERGADI